MQVKADSHTSSANDKASQPVKDDGRMRESACHFTALDLESAAEPVDTMGSSITGIPGPDTADLQKPAGGDESDLLCSEGKASVEAGMTNSTAAAAASSATALPDIHGLLDLLGAQHTGHSKLTTSSGDASASAEPPAVLMSEAAQHTAALSTSCKEAVKAKLPGAATPGREAEMPAAPDADAASSAQAYEDKEGTESAIPCGEDHQQGPSEPPAQACSILFVCPLRYNFGRINSSQR